MKQKLKIKSIVQLYDLLPDHEQMIVDILRSIIVDQSPAHIKEKISYNVPFFYGHRSLCLVWPSTIPRGGIKEGVLLGFWYGHKLIDEDHYLDRGTNKQVYYKIFKSVEEINVDAVSKILQSAIDYDLQFKKKK